MKTINENLSQHLLKETTTLATCWKITRTDGMVMGFTDHDSDVGHEGVTYSAKSGFTPSAVASAANLAADSMSIDGVLDSDFITEEDVLAGKYDAAEIEIFMVNFNAPNDGRLWLRYGEIGELTLKNGQFVAEVQGILHKLGQTIGDLYSPSCRTQFCDERCKLDLANYTVLGTITAVTSCQIFTDVARLEEDGAFSYGSIQFTSGQNNGHIMEVKRFDSGTVTTVLPMPYEVAIGDAYSMVKGCDKTFSTCVNTYQNALNFRGEPHVPGVDKILETSGTFS